MLDTCTVFGNNFNIVFNSTKTVVVSAGHMIRSMPKPLLVIASMPITLAERFKYMGWSFVVHSNLVVDIVPIKRKFYAALNFFVYVR